MKKIETSKIFLFLITLVTIATIIFTFWQIVETGDISMLSYLIPSIFVELGAATGVYYWKAKSENKIKMTLSAVKELSEIDDLTEEQVRIIEALINTLG